MSESVLFVLLASIVVFVLVTSFWTRRPLRGKSRRGKRQSSSDATGSLFALGVTPVVLIVLLVLTGVGIKPTYDGLLAYEENRKLLQLGAEAKKTMEEEKKKQATQQNKQPENVRQTSQDTDDTGAKFPAPLAEGQRNDQRNAQEAQPDDTVPMAAFEARFAVLDAKIVELERELVIAKNRNQREIDRQWETSAMVAKPVTTCEATRYVERPVTWVETAPMSCSPSPYYASPPPMTAFNSVDCLVYPWVVAP